MGFGSIFKSGPVSVGILNGILEVTAAGQAQRQQTKKATATAKQEFSVFSDKKNLEQKIAAKAAFVSTATAEPRVAQSIISNLHAFPIFFNLEQSQQDAILAASLGDVGLTKIQEQIVEAAKTNPTTALSLIDNPDIQGELKFASPNIGAGPTYKDTDTPLGAIVRAYAATHGQLTSDEHNVLQQINGDYDKAQAILSTIDAKNQPQLFALLSAISPSVKEYTPLDVTKLNANIELLKKQREDSGLVGDVVNTSSVAAMFKPSLTYVEEHSNQFIQSMDPSEKTKIANPLFDARAIQDEVTIRMAMKLAATEGNSNKSVAALFQSTVQDLKGLGAEAQKSAAKNQVDSLLTLFDKDDNNRLDKDDDLPPEALSAYQTILGIADAVEKIEKGTIQFKQKTGGPFNIALGAPLSPKTSAELLVMLNSNPKIKEIYTGLTEDGQAKFDLMVQSALNFENQKAMRERVTTVAGPSGTGPQTIREQGMPQRIDLQYSNLYTLDVVKTHLHTTLGIPKYGETTAFVPTLVHEQVDDIGTSLGPARIRLNSQEIVNVPHLAAFAEAMNTTAFELVNTNNVAHDMLDQNAIVPDSKFETALILKQMGFFDTAGSTDALTAEAYEAMTYTMIRNGHTDPQSQLQILAMLQSADVPNALLPARGTLDAGVPTARFLNEASVLLGRPLDLEGVNKSIANSNKFANSLTEAIAAAKNLSQGSARTDMLYSTYLNYFELEGGFFDTVGALIVSQVDSFIKEDDMQSTESRSAEDTAEAIREQTKEFLDTTWAKNHAKLASVQVTLAYNYAKTMDPTGRISERDYAAALGAVAGSPSAPREVSISLMEDFLVRAENNAMMNQMLVGSVQRFVSGDVYARPHKHEMQTLRAFKHIAPIKRRLEDQHNVRQYNSDLLESRNNNGINSPLMQGRYVINAKEAIKAFGQDLAMDGSIAGVGGGVYAVQKRSVTGGPINMIADRPLFIDSTGKILSQKQIKTLRQAYVGSQQ